MRVIFMGLNSDQEIDDIEGEVVTSTCSKTLYSEKQDDMFGGIEVIGRRDPVVYKRNEFIRAPSPLSPHAQKLLAICLTKQDPYGDEFMPINFSRTDLARLLSISRQRIYQVIDELTSELTSVSLTLPYIDKNWEAAVKAERYAAKQEGRQERSIPKPSPDDRGSYVKIPAFKEASFNKEARLVTFQFNNELRDYTLDLKGRYTYYQLANVLSLHKAYAIRLYEVLRSYLPHSSIQSGKTECAVRIPYSDLRESLSIEDQYQKPALFVRDVLEPAKKEVSETTDLNFEYELNRKFNGTRTPVEAVTFLIRANETVQHEFELEGAGKEQNMFLRQYLSPSHFKNIEEKYSPARILRNLDYVRNRLAEGYKIKRVSPYLARSLERDFAGSEMLKIGRVPISESGHARFIKDELIPIWESLNFESQDMLLNDGAHNETFKSMYSSYKLRNSMLKPQSKADQRARITESVMDVTDISWAD